MGSKRWQRDARSWDASREGWDCRDCSRLPEKKTRTRGETFEDEKEESKGAGEGERGRNRGNREVETAGRVQERKRKGRIR